MAMPLFFRAMTKQGDGLLLGQVLEQPQCKLLTVILDSFVTGIDTARLEQLLCITAAVFRPRNPASEDGIPQLFARTQVRHPDIEPIRRQTPSAPSGGEDSEPVFCLDWAMNRLRFDHFRARET